MCGVLVLSHCGYSFLEGIVKILKEKKLKIFILSSLPIENFNERKKFIVENSDSYLITSSLNLNQDDALKYWEYLKSFNNKILFVISVWEGYRHITALLNRYIGFPDLESSILNCILDKYQMRQKLLSNRLSNVNSYLIENKFDLDLLKKKESSFFLKPSIGIASYGAFILNDYTTWADLDTIISNIREDRLYKNVFQPCINFVAEDFIDGTEFSFEIIANTEYLKILSIHQKIEMGTIDNLTTLEGGSISPPINLSEKHINQLSSWILDVFNSLGLNFGCFHVEAKLNFNNDIWEIVEINPRVGGSFISLSVEISTGKSMLQHWIDLMLDFSNKKNIIDFSKSLKSTILEPSDTSSFIFFRTYYAHSGTIKSIEIKNCSNGKLIESNIFLKEGDLIQQRAREQFAAQALWIFNENIDFKRLDEIVKETNNCFKIVYSN